MRNGQQLLLIEKMIHNSSVIDKGAKIGQKVKIGPFCYVGPQVTILDNVELISNIHIEGNTKIGKGTKIFPFASIGTPPQDLKYKGESNSLEIGENNTIREYVTINPGTKGGGEKTIIGDNCLFMISSHVAHDCHIGNNVVIANNVPLGGHVTIGDWAILSGGVLVHQFCKIGEHAFVGAGGFISQDVPPFILAAGSPLEYNGINSVGLKRRGFSSEQRKEIKSIYNIFFRSKNNRRDNISSFSFHY